MLVLVPAVAAAPRTLVVTPRAVEEVAQHGAVIAWTTNMPGCGEGGEVWAARIGSERRVRLRRSCSGGGFFNVEGLTLANGRALWQEIYYDINSDSEGSFFTAALDDRRVRYLRDFYGPGLASEGGGLWPMIDRDRTGVVWAIRWTEVPNSSRCNPEGETPPTEVCRYRYRGEAWRVVGRSERRIRSVGPAVAVAATPTRIAYVPMSTAETTVSPAAPDRRVVFRRLTDGLVVRDLVVGGDVKALAFSDTVIAVLVKDSAGEVRIERYRVSTGDLLGVTAPAADEQALADVTASLDVGTQHVVYRVGNAIHAVHARTGEASVIWRARRPPIDLTVEGRRVVWGANGSRRGRILAITLPRTR